MSSENAPEATGENEEVAETESTVEANETEESAAVEEEKPKSTDESKSTDDGDKSSLPDDTEVLKREIAKLRKENAAKRAKNKEVEEAAKKWQQHVDSQKTELEKLQELAESLKNENAAYKLRDTQQQLAKEHGLDPDLAEFITGEDLDEMTEKAKKLAAKASAKKKKTTADDLRAGRRSDSPEVTGSKWLRELFN